jgi:hypothetical protein
MLIQDKGYSAMISGVSSARSTSIPGKACCAAESGVVFSPLTKFDASDQTPSSTWYIHIANRNRHSSGFSERWRNSAERPVDRAPHPETLSRRQAGTQD